MVKDRSELASGAPVVWDGRFRLELHGDAPALTVRALGRAGTRALGQARRTVPAPVRPGLPHLDLVLPPLARAATVSVRFNPAWPLAGAPFHAGAPGAKISLLRPAESIC